MGCCYIAGAGEFCENQLDIAPDDIVIAADGGYRHFEKLGITPDIIMGDFDSAPRPPSGKIMAFASEKDDTDMLLAVKHGFDLGFTEFKLYGGCGGRADHTFANIQTLLYIKKRGGNAQLFGSNEIFTVTDSVVRFDGGQRGKVSVFSLSERAEGVCEKGLKYTLDNAVLENSFPLGVSNEFTGEPSEISVKNGFLLIITERTK